MINIPRAENAKDHKTELGFDRKNINQLQRGRLFMDNFKKENNKNQKNMAQNGADSDKSKVCSDKVCSDKNKKTCVDNNKANKSKFEHKSGHKDREVGGKRVHSEKKHSAAPEKKYTKHTNY